MKLLAEHGDNRYSQYGEDGIIERIFQQIRTTSKVCVEVGAWDGFHLSNTANLWTRGWKGVLIEADKKRFRQLRENTREYDCLCIHAYVRRDGPDALEAILDRYGVREPIDLLSVDVDGNDYYVCESLRTLRPRVIVCEYNPTIPAELDVYAQYPSDFGCSAGALVRLLSDKGYRLVAVTDTNCLFVRAEHFQEFGAYETRLAKMKIDRHLVYLMTSYAGDYVASKRGFFGFTLPYTGKLHGPHCPIKPRTPWVRPVSRGLKKLKRLVKPRRGGTSKA